MFSTAKLRLVATLAAAGALSTAAAASARPVAHHPGAPTHVVIHKGHGVAYVEAFPTGDKGSGSEKTCGMYNDRLQGDQEAVDQARDNNDLSGYETASSQLEDDKDAALNHGCVVID